jgi:fatty acid desaturase
MDKSKWIRKIFKDPLFKSNKFKNWLIIPIVVAVILLIKINQSNWIKDWPPLIKVTWILGVTIRMILKEFFKLCMKINLEIPFLQDVL